MFVMVAYKMACASFVGPPPRGELPWMSCGDVALDGITRDDRIIHQQAERDDQARDRDLLQIDTEDLHHAESHGKGDWYRDGHERR